MRRLVMLVCAAVVLSLMVPASLEAFRGGPGGRWWKDPEVQQQVGLSPEQVEQLRDLYASHRPQMVDLRAEVRQRQLELDQLLESATVDEAAVGKKIDEIAAARAGLDKQRMTTLAKVRSLLTAEQYAKLRSVQRELRQARRGRRRARFGGGEGPGAEGGDLAGPGL